MLCVAAIAFAGCNGPKPAKPPPFTEADRQQIAATIQGKYGVARWTAARGGGYLDVYVSSVYSSSGRLREAAWEVPNDVDVGRYIHAFDSEGGAISVQQATLKPKDYIGGFWLTPPHFDPEKTGPFQAEFQLGGDRYNVQRFGVRITDSRRVRRVCVTPEFWERLRLSAAETDRHCTGE